MLRCLLSLGACFALGSCLFAQVTPENTLSTMKAGDGLQVELFAAEPMLLNPTSIDVDHLGRVWVAEAVNYRRKNFGRPILRPEGDRIQVLIDSNADGKADEAKTFYQGVELYGPLSVLVLPQADGKALRVLVAQSPDILEFWDKDGDLKADGPPTKWLSGFGGFDHDHGVHGLTVGPDGKLYFTVGDSGVTGLQSKDGKGKKFVSNTTDVQKGTVWRCDLNGNNLELIAHNFRNNYEACVDSFGEIWLSDNDDDGNQQTRICHVYPGGNYGYGPRGPGQSHWHEEQPGIVHKTLRTGFGSPTGICFYEGKLLPKQYQGDLIHADAGPREIRYFKRKPKGAGYELEKINMLTSTDNWFRPSDVCVAPDGSVMVADWYDPGVGGHGMGDWTRGRIYRLTPSGHKGYKVPEVKLDTKEGLLTTLSSPNLATRQVAFSQVLKLDHPTVRSYLAEGMAITGNPVIQSRSHYAHIHLMDVSRKVSEETRLPLPMTPETRNELIAHTIRALAKDLLNEGSYIKFRENITLVSRDPKLITVARELLLSMQVVRANDDYKQEFYTLAKLYDGQDIFYRAALNIACGTDPVRRDAILADFEKHFPEWNDKVADLVWELRPKSMLPKMEKLLSDSKLTAAQKARIVDILAANESLEAGKTMLNIITGNQASEAKAKAIENLNLFLPTKWKDLAKSSQLTEAISTLMDSRPTQLLGLQLVAAAKHYPALGKVDEIAFSENPSEEYNLLALKTLGALPSLESVKALKRHITNDRYTAVVCESLAAQMAGKSEASTVALRTLAEAIASPNAKIRSDALSALAGTRSGTGWLLKLKEDGKFPESLVADAGRLLRNSPFQGERNKAMMLFPAPGKLNPMKLPAITELAKRKGNAETGRQLMAKSLTNEVQCLKCHMVRGQGGQIGPDLSMIGKKGSRENLFESILYPSKAIADQYVSWKIDTIDGQSIVGLLVQETETDLTIRDANGKDYKFPLKDIEKKSKSLVSLMPEGLIATLTEDELIDLVEYMTTLQTASLTPSSWEVFGPRPVKPGTNGLDEANEGISPTVMNPTPLKPNAIGYFDLAAYGGPKSPNSVSTMFLKVESPVDQEVTILVGTDDGCRLMVNGKQLLSHDRAEAASPERDTVKATLKKGVNEITLKVANGNNPHGFYFTMLSSQELKQLK